MSPFQPRTQGIAHLKKMEAWGERRRALSHGIVRGRKKLPNNPIIQRALTLVPDSPLFKSGLFAPFKMAVPPLERGCPGLKIGRMHSL